MKTQFIPFETSPYTKAEFKKKHPNAKYSGKTIYDKDGNVERGPGFYI